jgi:hypothetical protein
MTAPTRGRRGSRRGDILATLDTVRYTDLVEEAVTAFSRDTAYSIDMARAAATIESKRNVWRQRLESRRLEESLGETSLSA